MRPFPKLGARPRCGLVFVTRCAGIWNPIPFGVLRGHEPKSVASHADRSDGAGNTRHVTGHTRAPFAICLMLRVIGERSKRAGLQMRQMTRCADRVARGDQVGLVVHDKPFDTIALIELYKAMRLCRPAAVVPTGVSLSYEKKFLMESS